MVFVREILLKWMITRGTHMYGKPHMYIFLEPNSQEFHLLRSGKSFQSQRGVLEKTILKIDAFEC